ncbi:adenine-specific methyltransferase EcoRI family protein [Lachnospiraceae bacterium LCP25S3_G4]
MALKARTGGSKVAGILNEKTNPKYDVTKTVSKGKIFVLKRDTDNSGVTDLDDLEWEYLEGDGDFRSDEVRKLRDEADVIITNPPFSLFRDFLLWVTETDKQFMMIGNINCITYKEVFPLIKANKAWLGNGMGRWISGFIVPEKYELYGTEARIENGKRIVATNNCLWLTNISRNTCIATNICGKLGCRKKVGQAIESIKKHDDYILKYAYH